MKLSSVAIIPDGNRRYSKKTSTPLMQAYGCGFKKSQDVVKWCAEAKIKSLTLWALSLENFSQRSKNELKILFNLMKKHTQKAKKSKLFEKHQASVNFFGKLELLPKDLQKEIHDLEKKTEHFDNVKMNVAMAYSGKEELLSAARKMIENKARPSETIFENSLYFKETPDLIIRTGNVQRLSGFLPWQAAYSELYFSPKLWPEFTQSDFKQAINYYNQAERRFGK
ncbi:MAG: polyprenyl diphosphate synthase [Candidatus Micrarchaeia archaeon]